jgi:mannan endo-1,6-alpha-mannosidase
MVSYWHYTGDASYNNITYNALVSQIGPTGDFVMLSESFDEVRIICRKEYICKNLP